MSDENHDRPSRSSTMRPPPPRPAQHPIAPTALRVPPPSVMPNDRPTPRSTVIPRLPATMSLPGMRPPLQTLIFHGAPPPLPLETTRPPPPPSPVPAPAPSFQDVMSEELLSDAELDTSGLEDEDDEPHRDAGAARTDRPPPARPTSLAHELRIVAGLAAAILIPIGIAVVALDHSARRRVTISPPPTTTAPAAAPARLAGTCTIDGSPKVLARRALLRGGVEASSLDDRVAFATLASPKTAAAFELDARTLAVRGTTRVVASDAIQHVVPELDPDAPIDAVADVTALRTVPDADGDAAFGVRDGYAVWGPRDGDGMVRLWHLSWPQTIEAPRVAPLGTSGERVAVFRRARAIWIGSFRGGQTTSDLLRLSTSTYAGAPALDARGDDAIVAWAERDTNGPWGVRWVRWSHAGAGETHVLTLPPGGPGERAIAPSVGALDDGRFLLAWTEAGHGKNQVRAQVIDASDNPLGAPLAVSAEGVVAGQETIALTDSGRGAVGYFVARRGAFELRAAALDCAR